MVVIIGHFMKRPILLLISIIVVMVIPLQADKVFKMVAIGDSLTAGTPFAQSPLETPPNGGGDEEGQYTYWMMRRRPTWEVLNYGIAGQTTAQIRARFPEALKQNPRCIIIVAGTNDIYQNLPVKRALENLVWMYKQAKGKSILPVAATLPPFNNMTQEQFLALQELNENIKYLAEQLRMPIADLYMAPHDPNHPDRLNGTSDEVHPDIGGYRQMGLEFIKVLDPIEKAWR